MFSAHFKRLYAIVLLLQSVYHLIREGKQEFAVAVIQILKNRLKTKSIHIKFKR